jgi:hypothetical protein
MTQEYEFTVAVRYRIEAESTDDAFRQAYEQAAWLRDETIGRSADVDVLHVLRLEEPSTPANPEVSTPNGSDGQ